MTVLTGKMKIAIAAVFCCLAIFFAVGGTLVWAQSYDGRVGPNTRIGRVDVSGMDQPTARAAVQSAADEILTDGAAILVEGALTSLPLSVVAGSDAVDAVQFDVDKAVSEAIGRAHGGGDLANAWAMVASKFRPVEIAVDVAVSRDLLASAIRNAQPDMEHPATDASFTFTKDDDGWKAEAVEGVSGDEFDVNAFQTALLTNLSNLSEEPTPLVITRRNPEVSLADAEKLTDRAVAALERAPFAVTVDSEGVAGSWTFTEEDLADMLAPGVDGLDVEDEAFAARLDAIAAEVETPAQNARFELQNGRVTEFAASETGLSVDRDAAHEAFVAALNGDATDVALLLIAVEPTVKTEDVNDMGIADMLGTGTSSYRGSPANRIKNIANGVGFLNGLLIAPGETFSLLNALKPFEISNGYLPELVIKGDKIEPEVGGGLCQIGTTTFRAALNSGLPINERSNHSLVVSYYNDPSNGRPGTDATIYDPAPDLKFTNDTGHYILFEAEMFTDTQDLRFTFWGTSDGRRGSYTPPVVDRWIPVAEPVMTETLDLPVGEKKCQSAHVGADAHFVYTVVKADGTSTDQTFSSHYRPLPELCLVGVEQLSTPDPLQPAEDGVSSSQTSDTPAESDASQTDQEQIQN